MPMAVVDIGENVNGFTLTPNIQINDKCHREYPVAFLF